MCHSTTYLTRSKSGVDLLYCQTRLEQFHQDEKAALDYLKQTLNVPLSSNLYAELKDGVILCNLVNKLKPGTIKQINQKDLSFVKMDNITRFLQGARQLGLNDAQLFETIDLFEAKDMPAVVHTILSLSRVSKQLQEVADYIEPADLQQNELFKEYEHDDHQAIFDTKNSYLRLSQEALLVQTVSSARMARPPKSPLRQPVLKNENLSPIPRSQSSLLQADKNTKGQSKQRQQRRLSSPTEGDSRRNNHTFPNRSHHRKEEIKGGSLGRQYKDTANEILSEHPVLAIEEKITLTIKDNQTICYQLGNCIGKGQFGSVYRALDLSTGETVAVKRLDSQNGDLDAEIMKEVSLLKTLSHTNVVRYLGLTQDKHSINIVLEYAENGSLMSTLKAFGPFPEKLVASFCIKILHGLEYLHQNQVVHCDLKAANILTTKTGDVKLTDFGVSLNLKIKGDDAGAVSGTPNWMAPEVIELKGASTKSDIWSLGCTIVELITGKPPYADMIAMSAMFRIVEDDYPPLPENVSDEMKDFLKQCFQKEPTLRPSANQLKQHPWIVSNNQRIKRTETYSHDLSNYLQNHQEDNALEERATLTNASCFSNESQLTLCPEENDTECHNSLGLRNQEDYVTHRFTQTSFGKAIECKVCGEAMTGSSMLCEICALVCHEHCKKTAFSCPPKVNDQQLSYDWILSAKVYNKSRKSHIGEGNDRIQQPMPIIQLRPEDAEHIRSYARALGLTPQEEKALNDNQALISHTLALQQQSKLDPGTLRQKAQQKQMHSHREEKRKLRHLPGRKGTSSEECIIS